MTHNLSVALCLALFTGCSAGSSSITDPTDASPSEGLFPEGALLVGPGPVDVANRFLPAVMVSTTVVDPAGRKHFLPCSGALIHPRLVVTAGHCFCLPRTPEPGDMPSPPAANPPTAGPLLAPRTRAGELRGVTLQFILDRKSLCAKTTLVTVSRYKPADGRNPGAETSEHPDSEVRIHPRFEVLTGERGGRRETVWASADLALLQLKNPVEFELTPLKLPTKEVTKDADIILVGYGPGDSPKLFGERQLGESRITQILPLETDSVIFRAEEQSLPDGGVSASAAQGDSGGPVVIKTLPNVLVGITSVGAKKDGRNMSVFMSAYSHLDWLREALQRVAKN